MNHIYQKKYLCHNNNKHNKSPSSVIWEECVATLMAENALARFISY